MPQHLVALVAGTRHAIADGRTTAACGAEPSDRTTTPWPGSGGGLCRQCARAVAGSGGTPTSTRRRPGGMG